MSILKKLAGQTAIYGIPSIVGRLINFLLVFLFTEYFVPEVFAAHTEFYAYAAFFLVLIPHGMETAYFNFLRRNESIRSVFSTSFYSVLVSVLFFLTLVLVFAQGIAEFMGYPEHPEYVKWFAYMLSFDVLAMLPFARLRHLEKALQFAGIRSLGIFVNIALNILFIVLIPLWTKGESRWYYNNEVGIGYVFIANLVASFLMLLLLVPGTIRNLGKFDAALWKRMMRYAWPLIFVGLAGIVNETFDRVAMDKLLVSDHKKFEIGVYGAFYKLSIIITIFIQAFRYAAEPFFFERSKDKDAKRVYAEVMNYFVAVCLFIALGTLLFLDVIAPLAIRQAAYFDHPDALAIVPILLLANVFLGVVYNLSIWYKVKEKTNLGAIISIGGALITIVGLVLFIPQYGFIAAAWTTLIVYFLMAVGSYLIGHRYYPVPYELGKLAILFAGAALFYLLDRFVVTSESTQAALNGAVPWLIKSAFVICYSVLIYLVVIRHKKT